MSVETGIDHIRQSKFIMELTMAKNLKKGACILSRNVVV